MQGCLAVYSPGGGRNNKSWFSVWWEKYGPGRGLVDPVGVEGSLMEARIRLSYL